MLEIKKDDRHDMYGRTAASLRISNPFGANSCLELLPEDLARPGTPWRARAFSYGHQVAHRGSGIFGVRSNRQHQVIRNRNAG